MTLPITKLRGGLFPKYRLDKDYRFEFQYDHRRAYFWIPAGFEYDGATFGSFLFWRKSLHESKHTLAHDWLYVNLGDVHARYLNHTRVGVLKKEFIDDLFLQAIRREINVQNWRSKIASGAFKTIGWFLWQRRKLWRKWFGK